MNTPNDNQDPQTAIDYNLYPSSARPSGLEVPQPSLSDKLENPDSDRTVMVDDLREAARQLRKLEEENSKLKSELAAFHAAMQRERKEDWEKWHMDLASMVDTISDTPEVASIKTPVSNVNVAGLLKQAARELRYMATSFTLKANFVPTDLEIKALKEQVESLEKQAAAMRDALQRVWDDSEMGWIVHSEYPDDKECSQCASLIPSQNHSVDCLQAVVHQALSTTAVRNYKSPEEVAAIVEQLETANLCIEGLEGNLAALESQLTAHTQALKVAKESLEACPPVKIAHSDQAAMEWTKALSTINNLLK